ncbi:hypothetical protein ACP70R_034364 [Stipagrostis hirtigluma subsp. patula]
MSEISLCRVYKRSGIDDGRGEPSSSNHTSSGRRAYSRTGRHASSPSSSTPLSPTQQPTSSFHLLQGECSSALPPAIMDQAITAHHAPPQLLPPPRPPLYSLATSSTAAVALAPQAPQGAAVLASTYSLLDMAAAPMGVSSRPVDELSTLVGHSHAYANLSVATGSHFLPLPPPPPMPQMAPLGALPMAAPLASVADKPISWDWNPVPDTTARDYNASGFK